MIFFGKFIVKKNIDGKFFSINFFCRFILIIEIDSFLMDGRNKNIYIYLCFIYVVWVMLIGNFVVF